MGLTIRDMHPGEECETQKLARKSFGLFEGLFVTKPKTALVAILDKKIVAGFMYQLEKIGGKKIGYASFFFTDPAFQGQGIGKRLCEEGVRRLWAEGCDALVTVVRDDNVASWGAFVKNGFARASLPKAAGIFGLPGMAKLHIKTIYWLTIGHELYVALRDGASSAACKKGEGAGQIFAYVFINMLLLLTFALRSQNAHFAIASSAFVFSGVVLAGFVGTLFSRRRKWKFRATSGGALLYALTGAIAQAFLPLIGNWYPSRYENTREFRRDMAANAIAAWMFPIGLAAFTAIAGARESAHEDLSRMMPYVSTLASVLLVFRCLPIPAFESSGLGRVFRWNKVIAILLVAASIFFAFAA